MVKIHKELNCEKITCYYNEDSYFIGVWWLGKFNLAGDFCNR